MLTIKQKFVALTTIAFMNLLVLLFMGPLVFLSLLASIPFAYAILTR